MCVMLTYNVSALLKLSSWVVAFRSVLAPLVCSTDVRKVQGAYIYVGTHVAVGCIHLVECMSSCVLERPFTEA